MKHDWMQDVLLPAVAWLPTTLPWRVAPWMTGERGEVRVRLLTWLEGRFAGVFPEAAPAEHARWARAHLDMMALERMDAMAFHRLGVAGGPSIAVEGIEEVREVAARGRGFILVVNHFDRLLTTSVALARHGIHLNTLIMPVLDNPELSPSQRRFLLQKIRGYASVTQRQCHPTSDGMRTVLEGLERGEGWVILADAWRPEFGRLRSHSFLGGRLELPTGIERVARSSGAALLHGRTYSLAPDRLRVVLEALPADPRQAIDQVVAQLEHDVREHPWAWWHWGQWEQMWTAQPQKGDAHGH